MGATAVALLARRSRTARVRARRRRRDRRDGHAAGAGRARAGARALAGRADRDERRLRLDRERRDARRAGGGRRPARRVEPGRRCSPSWPGSSLLGAVVVAPSRAAAAAGGSERARGVGRRRRCARRACSWRLLGAQYVLIGALDVLFVVLAIGVLDLGGSGAGYLNAAFGAGGTARRSRRRSRSSAGGASRRRSPSAAPCSRWRSSLIGDLADDGRNVRAARRRGRRPGRCSTSPGGRCCSARLPADVLRASFGVLEGLSMAGLAIGSLLVPALVALGGAKRACIVLGSLLPLVALLAGARGCSRSTARRPCPSSRSRCCARCRSSRRSARRRSRSSRAASCRVEVAAGRRS